ncbi:hypothetical protein K503DRAFT_864429 [Rhizopogon vinicolor AM-OR11-026]|uniref:Uncharacterized protein n=1 Tax=Rhizopogon vinicolor AM-OR11-026 TaxID=1314800 RepID=A0A1B7N7B1_9AGAM|nr:hypothetical protein K503DRAFT_864429 [Rhizopogon vinicolor AM-OR11-026]
MFHTYAAYRPPFKRSATRIVDNAGAAAATPSLPSQEGSLPSTSASPDSSSVSADVSLDFDADPTDSYMDTMPSFLHLPPQSPGEVLAEARVLFGRILQDTNSTCHSLSDALPGPLAGKFNVTLTPRLLNAYMSVHYSHASIESTREVFERLFSPDGNGFVGDAQIYVDALERCALAKSCERDIVSKWMDRLWTRWEELERGLVNGETRTTVTARLVERAHTAIRRVHLLTGNIDPFEQMPPG